jgi:hypothetical protein
MRHSHYRSILIVLHDLHGTTLCNWSGKLQVLHFQVMDTSHLVKGDHRYHHQMMEWEHHQD